MGMSCVMAVIVAVIAAACACAYIAAGAVIVRANRVAPPANLDYLIVLGAQIRPDGTPVRALRFRLEAARAYLAANPHTQAIVSGGRGANEPESEAAVMARWLERHGVDRARIAIEDASTTTAENIAYSMRLLGACAADAHIGIATNDYHLYRALRTARAQGLRHVYGVPAPSTPQRLPRNLLRECFALIKNRIQGNL